MVNSPLFCCLGQPGRRYLAARLGRRGGYLPSSLGIQGILEDDTLHSYLCGKRNIRQVVPDCRYMHGDVCTVQSLIVMRWT